MLKRKNGFCERVKQDFCRVMIELLKDKFEHKFVKYNFPEWNFSSGQDLVFIKGRVSQAVNSFMCKGKGEFQFKSL